VNIILTGIIGRHPYGGVGWCSLMYLVGLQRLGHEVWYVEDTGECNYDPTIDGLATDPSYALALIRKTLEPYGLGERWCYIDFRGEFHGMDRGGWRRACADADVFINLSGGSWFWRDEYAAIPATAFVDSDPAFTQTALASGPEWYRDFFRHFDCLFTFGANVGTPTSGLPADEFLWRHTWQPIVIEAWTGSQPDLIDPHLTTVMTWEFESFPDVGGHKSVEFDTIVDLPGSVAVPLEVAINAPAVVEQDLSRHGWRVRNALEVSRDTSTYRSYLQQALGELSVAKSTYVHSNSGWFSDRTECFLAAGRPAVVQDTGWSAHLPTGDGLFGFRDHEGAKAGVEALLRHPRRHRESAHELARAYFAHDLILPALLDQVSEATRTSP
jgi:hypothetical protein